MDTAIYAIALGSIFFLLWIDYCKVRRDHQLSSQLYRKLQMQRTICDAARNSRNIGDDLADSALREVDGNVNRIT